MINTCIYMDYNLHVNTDDYGQKCNSEHTSKCYLQGMHGFLKMYTCLGKEVLRLSMWIVT